MIFSRKLENFFTIFPILTSLTCTYAQDCEAKLGNSTEKLKCRLFANYDSSISPNTSANDYFQKLDLRIFYADIDVSGILQLIGDAKAIWKDNQMSWDPSEYHNTNFLDIGDHFHEIWKPEFILINNVFHKNTSLLGSDEYIIRVMHNGTVTFWTTYTSIQARCQIKIKSRPWFNHTCPLRFKTSTPNFIFNIHHQNLSSYSKFFTNLTNVNSDDDIESPWIVNETKKVQSIDDNGKSSSYPIIFDVELHRNIKTYKATQCISYPSSYEAELKCYLLSNFDLLSSPPEKMFSLGAFYRSTAFMEVSYIDYNIEDGVLLMIGGLHMSWMDPRITWDYEKFGDQYLVFLEPELIWKPSLSLNNNLFREDYSYFKNRTFGENDLVKIHASGNYYLSWTTSMNIYAKCDARSNSWPWDARTCSLNFTTDTPSLNAQLRPTKYDFEPPKVTSLWEIIDTKTESDFLNINIEITFKMKNHSSQIILCSTFVAVSSMTLSSFLIPPINKIKLPSKLSSFLLLLIFLVILMNSIPYLTMIAPNFVIGFIVLILVVGISSCITTTCIVWFARKSHTFHQLLIMEIMHPEEEDCNNDIDTDESPVKKTQNAWLKMASVIEYCSFAICLIIVTCLTISLMT